MNTTPDEHTSATSGGCSHDCDCHGEPAPSGGSEVSSLRAELNELTEKYRRILADFQNYQKRSLLNEQRARTMAISDLARTLIIPMDHLELALQQADTAAMASPQTAQIRDGVRLVCDEFIKSLAAHGINRIEVKAGDEFLPGRHEAVTQITAEGIEAGRIAQCFQAGYTAGEFVIRPAKVAVATDRFTTSPPSA